MHEDQGALLKWASNRLLEANEIFDLVSVPGQPTFWPVPKAILAAYREQLTARPDNEVRTLADAHSGWARG